MRPTVCIAGSATANTRHWKQTLVRLRESVELTSLSIGDQRLFSPVDKAGSSTRHAPGGTKPVLVHIDVADRETLLDRELAKSRSAHQRDPALATLDNAPHLRTGPRVRM